MVHLLAAAWLLWGGAALEEGRGAAPLPTAEEVVARMRENNRTLQGRLEYNYSYDVSVHHTVFSRKGALREQSRWVVRIAPSPEGPVRRLVSVNGREPDARLRAREEKQRRKEARRRARAARREEAADEDPGRQMSAYSLTDLLALTRHRVVRREEREGRSCLVLEFEPRRRIDAPRQLRKVMGVMAGTVWVTEPGYQMLRLEARAEKGIRFAAGLAKVKAIQFHYDGQQWPSGLWMPRRVTFDLEYRNGFKHGRVHQEKTYGNYQEYGVQVEQELAGPLLEGLGAAGPGSEAGP